MADTLTLPGFVNAHCHAFQRALRGRGEGGDFWAWRELMLAEAERQTPTLVRSEYAEVYRELRRAGYTAVGEFHYLGFDEALGAYAREHDLPLHVHADEQPREIEECVAEHGLRPIELLAETECLTPRTTVVHATHADGRELDLLAQAGARVCACPTTEANLGEGFLLVERLLHRGIGLCIGSDSNVRIDPFEELRELDGIARRQSGRRNVFTVDDLLSIGSDEGAASLGLEESPQIEIDTAHEQLRGVDEPLCALVHGCTADVVVR